MPEGTLTGEFRGLSAAAHRLCFSHDGRLLAAGCDDGRLVLWRVADREIIASLTHDTGIEDVAFHPDDDTVACCVGNDVLLYAQPWSAAFARRLPHSDLVRSVAFSPQGDRVAVAADQIKGKEISLWHLDSLSVERHFPRYDKNVRSLAFSPDGRLIACGDRLGHLSVIEIESGREIASWKAHTTNIYEVDFSSDSSQVLSAGKDKIIRVFDLKSGEAAWPLMGHERRVHSACFVPNDKRVVSGGGDGTVRTWRPWKSDFHLDEIRPAFNLRLAENGRDVALSKDGQRLAEVDGRGFLRIFDTANMVELNPPCLHGVDATVAWSPGARHVISAGPPNVSSTNEQVEELPARETPATGDLEGDGDADLVTGFGRFSHVIWQETLEEGLRGPVKLGAVQIGTNRQFATNRNEDHDLELICRGYPPCLLRCRYSWFGPRVEADRHTMIARVGNVFSFWAEALDGDGDDDVVTATASDGVVAWHENRSDFELAHPRPLTTQMPGVFVVIAADLDGDARHDVVAASQDQKCVCWFRNLGGGDFSEERVIIKGIDLAVALDTRDVDGDGTDDVVVASPTGVFWCRNQGQGTFGPQCQLRDMSHDSGWNRDPLEKAFEVADRVTRCRPLCRPKSLLGRKDLGVIFR